MLTRADAPVDPLRDYREAHRTLIDADPEFAAWLETEYRPIEGGWQY